MIQLHLLNEWVNYMKMCVKLSMTSMEFFQFMFVIHKCLSVEIFVSDYKTVFLLFQMMLLIGRSFAAAIFTVYTIDIYFIVTDPMSMYMVCFHVSIFCYIGVLCSIIFYAGNKVSYEVFTHIS